MSEENAVGIGPSLGDAGSCPTIKMPSKTWSVGHPTQRAKGELELLVAQVALANLEKMQRVLSKAKYLEKCAALDAKIEGGHHQTWGSLWTSVNSGPDGNNLFLLSLLRERHPEAELSDAIAMYSDEPRQVKLALAIVVPSFFALLVAHLPLSPEERAAKTAVAVQQFIDNLMGEQPELSIVQE